MEKQALKLYYFDFRGRAEVIRQTLAIGGIEFDDIRLGTKTSEDFLKIKPKLPFGLVPVIEVNGVMHAQTLALWKYAGRVAGLYPSDALEALVVDQIMEGTRSILDPLQPTYYYGDNEKTLRVRKELVADEFPKYFEFMENLIQGEFVLVDKITVADVAIRELIIALQRTEGIPESCFSKYEKINRVVEKVAALPAVQQWEQDGTITPQNGENVITKCLGQFM